MKRAILAISVAPVSYTHRDVYKRQHSGCDAGHLRLCGFGDIATSHRNKRVAQELHLGFGGREGFHAHVAEYHWGEYRVR